MSASQQAKAARRKMRNRYAHMGNSLQRPRISGQSYRSVSESIAAARATAARVAKATAKRK